MKNMFKYIIYTTLFVLICSCSLHASTERRVRYMGTSIFTMPTGQTRSSFCYINDAGHTATLISQALMGGFLELSYLRHMNDAEEGKNIMSAKVKVLEEGGYTPGVVWGISDINTQLGSKIFYFAASKSIEMFGCTLHGGYYKDPVTTEKVPFYGFEKMVFPLVTIAAERADDIDSFGVKLSPYPGLSLEIGQRDSREEFYNINYIRSF